jgi:hypothetical protein
MNDIIEKIQSRIGGSCLPRVLQQTTNADGTLAVQCLVREYAPAGQETDCTATGRMNVSDGSSRVQMLNGVAYHVCDIVQVFTNPDGTPAQGSGWYYNNHPPASDMCQQEITFTDGVAPPSGAFTRLECIQSISIPST